MVIDLNNPTMFDCPHCRSSKLIPYQNEKNKIEVINGLSSEHHIHHQTACEYDETEVHVFALTLSCTNPKCKAKTIVTGRLDAFPDYSGEVREYETKFEPKYFYPTVDLVLVPECIPDSIRKEIRRAFALHFCDAGAAAMRLRRAVECFLDNVSVAVSGQDSKTLHGRLRAFHKIEPATASLLIAVKWLGNDGSHHGSEPTQSELLDGYEVLIHALENYYDNTSSRMSVKASRLSKGRSVL